MSVSAAHQEKTAAIYCWSC